MHTGLKSGTGIALALALLLALNLLAGLLLPGARFDLTAQKLYTLSDGTRRILAELKEPITLRYYYSAGLLRELPQVRTYAERVRALLKEYVQRSHGRIRLEVVDPEPYSEAEDAAVQFGLRGLPAGSGGEVAYFGIAGTNSTDGEEVLPFLTPAGEETLEYDLTRLIYNLGRGRRPTVALISSLPLAGSMVPITQQRTPQWAVMDQMRSLFQVHVLGTQFDAIPPDTDVLMLVHPKGLKPKALYQIDQFVLRGGRVLAFLDPYADVEAPPRDPMMPTMTLPKEPSDLGGLPAAWGIEWDPAEVVADPENARRVEFAAGGPQDYPVWLSLDQDHVAPKDVVSRELRQLYFATAGALRRSAASEAEFTPLVWSGPQAGRVPAALVEPPPDLRRLREAMKPAGAQQVLAARITGPLRSAFPDGPPQDAAGQGGGAGGAHLAASAQPANLVVVADADLLYERFWAQVQDMYGERLVMPFADNADLAVNALDNLAGSDALISVRGGGNYARPFTVVAQLEREAQAAFQARERELEARLEQTEQRLAQLQQQRGSAQGPLLTPEQQAEIERFRAERVRVRKELRAVQRDLRRDIERLETRLRFLNIGLVPLLIAFGALLAALLRGRTRRAAA